MTSADIKAIIRQELPQILAEDLSIRDFILRTVSDYYAPKQETEDKFNDFLKRVDRILDRLDSESEEQARKWEEQNGKWDEQNRKWEENNRRWDSMEEKFDRTLDELERDREEQNRKWDEQNRKWEENNQRLNRMEEKIDQSLEEIKKANKRYDSTIGALGSRWGLYSEASFRNALAAILQESFGVQVLNINDYDPDGIVFGRPDQVEIDVIIKNGLVIVCEIKSSMSKSDIYIFDQA